MTRRVICVGVVCAGIVILAGGAIAYYALKVGPPDVRDAIAAGRVPKIWPDYSDTIVPPNIAPLNFVLSEEGERYYVRVFSTTGDPIEVVCDDKKIRIPIDEWRKLLQANKGEKLRFESYVLGHDGKWIRYDPIVNTIAQENIDSHLAYRLITPIYNFWKNVGIYQRDLEGFDQSVILHNSSFNGGCVNCHTFSKNDPAEMLVNVRPGRTRKPPGGMLVVRDGAVAAVVNTKTDFNPIPAIYLSWHPGGELIAFSSNKITQFFHSTGENRDVFDHFSDLAVYHLDRNMVASNPEISRPDRMETYPTWSPDGKYLYFCSAPQMSIRRYKQVRYDLMRITYDIETGTWGKAETVLSSKQTGLSITHPRISPDCKFLLFCMCKYGNFSIYRPDSDLYMMDLETGRYRRLEINSDRCESWHDWSSNGRWIVFSSKRRDGLFAKPYFSYVDDTGKVHKPLLLPQSDPTFYDSFIKTYNVPQFITGPIPVSPRGLAAALHAEDKQIKAELDPDLAIRGPSPQTGG